MTYGNSINMDRLTRRQYLLIKVLSSGNVDQRVNIFMAQEAVESTALAHPEWDMDEIKSFKEWENE